MTWEAFMTILGLDWHDWFPKGVRRRVNLAGWEGSDSGGRGNYSRLGNRPEDE